MAYVTGFAHDVFVSYAHLDNEAVDGPGWVDILLDRLRQDLQRRLGSRELDIFVDHALIRSNLSLSSQLLDAARSSAALLVVMSPSYLRSSWCDRERRAFLDVVMERVKDGSVFVVHTCDVDREQQPEELRDLTGIKFFTPVEGATRYRRLGEPDPKEPAFFDRISALSGELAEQLGRCRARQHFQPAPQPAKRVFVATATDDLEDREAELRSYLQQAGLEVVPSPQSRYPMTDLAAYEAAVLRELEGSCLFAQLLSTVHGKDLPFAPDKRMPALQHELAQRAKKPVLQWRDRGQAIDGVKDPAHRALLEAAQACGIEEFKRSVTEQALRPPPAPDGKRGNGDGGPAVYLFVNADTRDDRLAREVSDELSKLDVDCYGMEWTGSPAEIRKTLTDNLNRCDGFILVYGEAEPSWVHEQLSEARKATKQRKPPISAMAIFQGPPVGKPELLVRIKNLDLLDCRKGLDAQKLRGFVEHLRK